MKDMDKQPGIRFDDIILIKEEFERIPEYPDEVKISIEFEFNSGKSDEYQRFAELVTTVICLSNKEEEVLRMKCIHIGFFSTINDEENMDIDEFIENNSAALMFPFIREHIYSTTKKAGVNPISLPPINVRAMIKNKNS